MVWLVLGGAPAKFGDMLCVLPILSGGIQLPGCPLGGSRRQGSRPVKAELRAGGADDGDVHGLCYHVEGVIDATSSPRPDARGETLDLGLADRTMVAIMVLFSLLGLCFGTCSGWRG
jgi:hypothetical protein